MKTVAAAESSISSDGDLEPAKQLLRELNRHANHLASTIVPMPNFFCTVPVFFAQCKNTGHASAAQWPGKKWLVS